MRNLKKVLAVITVVAMLASMTLVPALAASFQYEAEATALNSIGLMAGMNLGDAVTRIQGLTFAVKAAGKDAAAQALTDAEVATILANVVDADQIPAWGLKYAAYAVKNGFTSGTDTTVAPKVKFSPMQGVTGDSFLYWLLKIGMGYNVASAGSAWETAVTPAKVITLSQGYSVHSNGALIRDDVAGILYGAAKNGLNNDGKAFIQSLIDAGFVTNDAAVAAGFVAAAPAALKIESVTASNLKQLVVKFNMELKAAGDENNYSLATDGAAVLDENSDFSLQADKKTVVITLSTASAQQETVDLTVKNVESATGLKLAETKIEDVELYDKTIPSAVSAAVVGKYAIKVSFSEPMDAVDAGDFTVDGGDYIVEKAEASNNNTDYTVYVYSPLEAGTAKIECSNAIKDYAGYGIPKKTFDLSVVPDETAPVVVGYKDAKPGSVTLIFNEDLDGQALADNIAADATFINKFYHTNDNNPATEATISGKELTLDFSTNNLPEGTAYLYIEKESLQDLWENENAKIAYKLEVTLDTVKPTLDKVEQGDDQNTVVLTFSEDLDATTATDSDNYTLLDKDGKALDENIGAALDGDEVTLTFGSDLSGDYSIVVQDVEDLAGNAIAKVTKAFTMKDSKAPLFADVSAKIFNPGDEDQMILVKFGEAMAVTGNFSVVDLDKYVVADVNLSKIKDAKIKAVNGNKDVEITIPYDEAADVGDEDYSDGVNFANNDTLVIARVADAANNKTAALTSDKELDENGDPVALVVAAAGTVGVDKVELTNKNTVVVTLKDKLSTFKSTDFVNSTAAVGSKSSLTNTVSGVEIGISRIKQFVNSDGVSVITMTLTEDFGTTTGDGITFDPLAQGSKNSYGEVLSGAAAVVADKAAPTVDKVNFISDTEIQVVFTEAIDDATVNAVKNGFSVGSGSAELTTAVQDAGDATTFILTGKKFTKYTDVKYTAGDLADVFGNKVASFTRTDTLDLVP